MLKPVNNEIWLFRKGKYNECGSGLQPRNQMLRLEQLTLKFIQ